MKLVYVGMALVGVLSGCASTQEVDPPGEKVTVTSVEEWCGVVKVVPPQTAGRAIIESGHEHHYGKCRPMLASSLSDFDDNESVSIPHYSRLQRVVQPSLARQLKQLHDHALENPTQDNVDVYLEVYEEADRAHKNTPYSE